MRSTPPIRWAATAVGSRIGSCSTSCCRCCGSAARIRASRRQHLLGQHNRARRDEWIRLGLFTQLRRIALDAYDRIVGLLLEDVAMDGCITKALGGGEVAGPSPVDRRKQGMKRSLLVDGYGIPLGRVLAGAHRHNSPLLAPPLDTLGDLGPQPADITVHLDSGYDSGKDPRHPRRARPARQDRTHRHESADPGHRPLARRTHQRLARQLQPAATLLRTTPGRGRGILRPRRHDHHRT
jgi:hypothetical protein